MSSANFLAPSTTLVTGGGHSSSASFLADDTLGEIASGEDLTSASFRACAGFECFQSLPYIAFSVKEGTSAPGTVNAGVDLGTITPSDVVTSNHATVNSIFLTSEANAASGYSVTVRSQNAALQRISNSAHKILSATASLVAGTAGYGVCVTDTDQHADSPSAFLPVAPYDDTCTITTGHDVGIVDTTNRTIVASTAELKGGTAEILVKAAASTATLNGTDYSDTLTFVASAAF